MTTNEDAESIPVLEAISQKAGDPDLFPREVLELHAAGRALEAHRCLTKHVKQERNRERARLQRECLQDLRLWGQETKPPGMSTLNGIGARLVGKHQIEEDGTYIATLWFTILFIPLWPIASYVVAAAEEGGWYFLARTPLVGSLRLFRTIVARGLVLLALLGGWYLYHESTHVDIHVVNGFDVPVSVEAGGEELTVQGGQHGLLEDLPGEPTRLTARVASVAEPLETHEIDLSEHLGKTVVYNVAARALVERGSIRYGPGDPPPGELLPSRSLQALPVVDYPFTTPPEQKEVREGGMIQNSILEIVGSGADAMELVAFLMSEDLPEHALAVARSELRVHPDRPALAFVAANYLLGGDLEAGLELFRECLSAAPDSVDLHRYYQEFWPYAQRAAVIAEYDALLAENPSSAMLQYLAGRLRDDADAALAFYTRAMELEPDFPPSYRAYGYQASIAGDLDTAARMYERYAAFSPQHADECVRERVRVSRWQGRPAREIAALLEETTAGEYETEAAVLRRHLAVAASPARLEEEMKALAEGPSEGAALLEAQAALAVTAGRLELARERLGALGDLGGGSQPALGSLLRLALSDGSAADDRTRLRERLASDGAGALSGGEVLLALALAKGQAWPQQGEISERLEGTELAAAAALVREPSAISSSRLAEALVPLAPSERAVVHLALALRASGAQRGRLRRQARNLALPDELPWLR